MENPSIIREADRLDVLIVDDDAMLAEFVALELESLGCQVRCVSSGAEALQRVDENVDLLVTDWQMPQMDGMELVRRVREDRGRERHLHIAMMTGREDSGAMFSALQAGVDDFLYKPVDRVQLELAVASARRNGALHRRLTRRNQLLAAAHQRTREALDLVRSDFAAAVKLHERLLPQTDRLDGVRAAHVYKPALLMGGDTIGATDLGGGKTLFFIVDVRGHGVPAALDSFHLHHRIKQMRPTGPDTLVGALAALNREIADRGDDSYATMLCGIIDKYEKAAWIVRAGHPPPVLVAGGKTSLFEEGGSLPLGWFADTNYEAQRIPFDGRSRLVAYSDGLTECVDRRGRELGSDNLVRVVAACNDRPLAEIGQSIELVLRLRTASADLLDDVSLLALELEEEENVSR